MDCPKPEDPLSKRLDELGPCWLELSDRCQLVYMPLPLLIKKRGGGLMLRDVLLRLRCSRCGGKPAVMTLVERADGGRPRTGAPDGWRIPLEVTLPRAGA
jgi:hypothetical protein